MLKFAVLLCVVLVLKCNIVCSVSDAEIEKMSEICKVQENASYKDMENWKNDIKPKSRMVKCLDACVGEKLGMLVNNRLNVDAMAKVIEVQKANEKVKYDFYAILDKCKSITNKDRCETSAMIQDCINEGAVKLGMKEFF